MGALVYSYNQAVARATQRRKGQIILTTVLLMMAAIAPEHQEHERHTSSRRESRSVGGHPRGCDHGGRRLARVRVSSQRGR